MKLAIIVFVVSLLVGGGGFTAYMMLVEGKSFPEIKAMVVTEPEEPPKPTEVADLPGVFYEMRPIQVTALRDGTPQRHLTMVFVVEFRNQQEAALYEPAMHRLHHAFLQYIHTIAQYKQFDDVRDAPLLRSKLQAIADEMFGKGVIRSILLKGEQRTILENNSQ